MVTPSSQRTPQDPLSNPLFNTTQDPSIKDLKKSAKDAALAHFAKYPILMHSNEIETTSMAHKKNPWTSEMDIALLNAVERYNADHPENPISPYPFDVNGVSAGKRKT